MGICKAGRVTSIRAMRVLPRPEISSVTGIRTRPWNQYWRASPEHPQVKRARLEIKSEDHAQRPALPRPLLFRRWRRLVVVHEADGALLPELGRSHELSDSIEDAGNGLVV